ncbi:hypothetical protein [Stomatohabitans albus]|uniref:hypothetical protein n=1 Tax=Stomatohabitans albus TaxID=3110766 RepID=UPI00300D095E
MRLSRTVVTNLLAMMAVGLAMGMVSQPSTALEYPPPGVDKQDHYVGVPRLWPADLITYATGQPNDYDLVPLLAEDDKPLSYLRFKFVDPVPAGTTIIWHERNWYLRVPVTNPYPWSNVHFIVYDRDGKWSRSGMILHIKPNPDAGPTPPEPSTPPAPQPQPDPSTTPTPPPAPGPTNNPTPPSPESGPRVTVTGGTFPAGQRNTIPVTITPPAGTSLKHALWYGHDGFALDHVEGERWEVIITPEAKPGMYKFAIEGVDSNDQTGAKTTFVITLT